VEAGMSGEYNQLIQYLDKKEVVVFVGAGISKAAPSTLPSWWEYNFSILSEIGNIAAKALKINQELLQKDEIEKSVEVVSISEFFVHYIAGDAYFPLTSLLNSSKPNHNHYILAELSKSNKIKAIITTNFDTLIEQAFTERNEPLNVYYRLNDFEKEIELEKNCCLFKIHGSVVDTATIIDTVSQKLKGLDRAKTYNLKKIFRSYHLLVVGFSGEDFSFDQNYIPFSVYQSNELGVTWIKHPTGKVHESVMKLVEIPNFTIHETTLEEFYLQMGWKVTMNVEKNSRGEYKDNLHKCINSLVRNNRINKWSCIGMCIQLFLYFQNRSKALEIALRTEEVLYEKFHNRLPFSDRNWLVPLLDTLGYLYNLLDNGEKALHYYNQSLGISNARISMMRDIDIQKSKVNTATTLNSIGLVHLFTTQNYNEALKNFTNAAILSFEARKSINFILAFIRIIFLKYSKHLSLYAVCEYEAIKRLAKQIGFLDAIIEINLYEIYLFIHFGYKNEATNLIKDNYALIELSIKKNSFTKTSDNFYKMVNKIKKTNVKSLPDPTLYIPIEPGLIWTDICDREILSIPEGMEAYKYYCNNEKNIAKEIVQKAVEKFKSENDWINEEIFVTCMEGLMKDEIIGTDNGNKETIRTREKLLLRAAELQIKMAYLDYLVATTAKLAQCYYMFEQYEEALYMSEFCLCLCQNPVEHGIIIHTCAVAAFSCREIDKYSSARQYALMYIDFIKKYPQNFNCYMSENINELLDELNSLL
jgi:hypothetical protein